MKNFGNIIALLILGAAAGNSNEDDSKYCEICSDHTLCKYQGLGPSCKNSVDGGVNEEEQKYILEVHNWFRRVVSKGLETRTNGGALPQAAAMRKMVWDDELARSAQRWADQCEFEHDSCREDPRWKVGQNLYWHWRYPVTRSVNWTAAMFSWFDEAGKLDVEVIESYKFDPETGHYTQLIWHDTTHVGCGQRTYGSNKIYVCNYGPTGNWLEEAVYEAGDTCSACPRGTWCQDGLCEKRRKSNRHHPNHKTTLKEDEPVVNAIIELSPPSEDSVSVYDVANFTESSQVETTEIPLSLNVIDDLDIPDDEEIHREIEELKHRIRLLVDKIALRNAQKH